MHNETTWKVQFPGRYKYTFGRDIDSNCKVF